MPGGGFVESPGWTRAHAQRIDELIEEARHPELQFRCRRRHGAHLDLRPTAADELFAILGDEVVYGSEVALASADSAVDHRRCRDALHCIEAEPLALDGAADGETLM